MVYFIQKKEYAMRIITVNSQTGCVESVVQLRKEKIQQYLFTVHVLVIDVYGRVQVLQVTFFQEVEVVIAEEISPVMAFFDSLSKYRLC